MMLMMGSTSDVFQAFFVWMYNFRVADFPFVANDSKSFKMSDLRKGEKKVC